MDSQIIDHKKHAVKTSKQDMPYFAEKKFRYLPPTYFKVTLVSIILVDVLFPNPEIIQTPVRYLGIIPIIFGLIIMLWAHQIFENNQTAIRPDDTPSHLVTSGPFQYTRHPMYLGFVVIILGVGIILGSLLGILGSFVLFIILDRIFISHEEEKLEHIFGEEYLDYRNLVRKWI